MNWPRTVRGYTNLGPIRIPPLAPHVILTDRDDATLWHLSFTTTPPNEACDEEDPESDCSGYVSLNDQIPTDPYKHIYPADAGPVLRSGPWTVRLLVRGGYLGFEVVDTADLGPGAAPPIGTPTMARDGLLRDGRQMVIPVGFAPPNAETLIEDTAELGWHFVDFSQSSDVTP